MTGFPWPIAICLIWLAACGLSAQEPRSLATQTQTELAVERTRGVDVAVMLGALGGGVLPDDNDPERVTRLKAAEPKLRRQVAQIYEETLTVEEREALIQFVNSPHGQSAIRKIEPLLGQLAAAGKIYLEAGSENQR